MHYAIIVLVVLLLCSVGGNAYQYHEHDGLVTEAATQKQAGAQALAAAATCSGSVDALAKQGRQQQQDLVKLVSGSYGRVAELQHEANDALRARPADPKDLCGSLEKYLRAQIAADRAKRAQEPRK